MFNERFVVASSDLMLTSRASDRHSKSMESPCDRSWVQITSETLFDGTSTPSIDPTLSNGLLTPGASGGLSTAYGGSVTDPDGHATTLAYNWMSHATGEEEATGASSATTYSSLGFPVTATDALGRVVTYTFNQANEVVTEKSPTGGLTTVSYDLVGNTLSVTDPDDYTISYAYDADNGCPPAPPGRGTAGETHRLGSGRSASISASAGN